MPSVPPRPLTLLLLPGMDGDGRLFDRLRARLVAESVGRIEVVSYAEGELSSYADIEAVVRARLAELGPVVVLGESFSGPVVVRLCAQPPPNLRAGILLASFLCSPVPVPPGLSSALARGLFALPSPRWALRLALVGGQADDALLDDLQAVLSETPSAVLAARLRSVLAVDVRAEAARLARPLLRIRASKDRLLPSWRRPRGPEEVELEGPHLLAQVQPGEVAGAIASFLRGLPAGTS